MKRSSAERRKYIRLEAPINVSYTLSQGDKVYRAVSKNISALGLRFQIPSSTIEESSILELALELPSAPNPVHVRGKVIWVKKLTLEDNAPFDVGVEFEKIDEDNKNTFLKYLCDLIYSMSDK
ncbi:PilZ domain-containing protein [Candidatus Omnitrophota bacterium]